MVQGREKIRYRRGDMGVRKRRREGVEEGVEEGGSRGGREESREGREEGGDRRREG